MYIYFESVDKEPSIIDISIDGTGCFTEKQVANVGDIAIWYNTDTRYVIMTNLENNTKITINPKEDFELVLIRKGNYNFNCEGKPFSIPYTENMKSFLIKTMQEMRGLIDSGKCPEVVRSNKCGGCSCREKCF